MGVIFLHLQHSFKNRLSAVKKYKPFAALVLIVLYAFIATPVQLWHHHKFVISAETSSLQKDDKSAQVASAAADTLEDNCQLCSHQYSVYGNDHVAFFELVRTVSIPREGFYALTIPSAPCFDSSNKGPPALA